MLSVQVVMTKKNKAPGSLATRMPLRKFGAKGGACYRWNMSEEDYIREIEFTFASMSNDLQAIKFVTDQGQVKIIGPSLLGI